MASSEGRGPAFACRSGMACTLPRGIDYSGYFKATRIILTCHFRQLAVHDC